MRLTGPMHDTDRQSTTRAFWLLVVLLVCLWIAGGASRSDVLGQAVTRGATWTIVILAILSLPRIDWRVAMVPIVILAAGALSVALQLLPLPPAVWAALPGREIFLNLPLYGEGGQPWRALSVSPEGTRNALSSLIVPAAVIALAVNVKKNQHIVLAKVVVTLIAAGALLGVIQFAEVDIRNPLLNSATGVAVSGNFANRNHFALFLSMGLFLSFALSFHGGRDWKRLLVTICAASLFFLVILASGSRTGILLGILAIISGIMIIRQDIRALWSRAPARASLAVIATGLVLVALLIWLAILSGRADAIERIATSEEAAGLRGDIWQVVRDMAVHYFPAGSGYGTFDAAFRISEPDSMLRFSHVNQAHNDFLQVALEGGIPGLVVMALAMLWFLGRAMIVWRGDSKAGSEERFLGRLGSVLILLVLVASVPDYPARTPMIMSVLALSSVWLSLYHPERNGS